MKCVISVSEGLLLIKDVDAVVREGETCGQTQNGLKV